MYTTCGYCLRAAFSLFRASGLCSYDSKGGNYSTVASDWRNTLVLIATGFRTLSSDYLWPLVADPCTWTAAGMMYTKYILVELHIHIWIEYDVAFFGVTQLQHIFPSQAPLGLLLCCLAPLNLLQMFIQDSARLSWNSLSTIVSCSNISSTIMEQGVSTNEVASLGSKCVKCLCICCVWGPRQEIS